MIILGITGGIGSGKSIVSEIFSLCDIPVYIADIESKKLTNSSPIIRQKLTNLFGEKIYIDGLLDKSALASIIFNDKKKLQQVNEIIHPEVKNDLCEWISSNYENSIVAYESAIMFESGFHVITDEILTVYTPLETRIDRIIKRDNSTRQKAQERIQSQMPDEEKVKLSDYVIVNDETQSLIEQVVDILDKLGNKK